MSNQNLWAPWRLAYIKSEPPPTANTEGEPCFLCRYLAEQKDAENLVLLRTNLSCVVLNRYPYNNGHLLVAPLAHTADFRALGDDEMLDLQRLIGRMLARIGETMRPDGFNVGLNLGRVAGAGLPGHLHWHIVPRWNGDTNFMPVLADVNVVPQSLEALYHLLSQELAASNAG